VQERAPLEWAEKLTLISETHPPEEVYRDTAADSTREEIVDLTIAIGLMNVLNCIAIRFGRGPTTIVEA
jgi:alkylhydroperoxidase family enzyme